MEGRVPRWEAELWSYVSSGDGMRCPLYSRFQARKRCGWCPDKNKERLSQLLDDRQFDLNNYYFIESEGGRLCRVFQPAEMLAQNIMKKGRVDYPPVPASLVYLADDQHPVEVRLIPLMAHHGAIWRLEDSWVIQLNENDEPARRRFTLFHEAFHILAHSRATPVFRKRGLDRGSFNELLADYFAACILMPRQWVVEKWAGVRDLDRMAEIFDVPKPVMCVRLRQLDLV